MAVIGRCGERWDRYLRVLLAPSRLILSVSDRPYGDVTNTQHQLVLPNFSTSFLQAVPKLASSDCLETTR
jgi:hypothetical protein